MAANQEPSKESRNYDWRDWFQAGYAEGIRAATSTLSQFNTGPLQGRYPLPVPQGVMIQPQPFVIHPGYSNFSPNVSTLPCHTNIGPATAMPWPGQGTPFHGLPVPNFHDPFAPTAPRSDPSMVPTNVAPDARVETESQSRPEVSIAGATIASTVDISRVGTTSQRRPGALVADDEPTPSSPHHTMPSLNESQRTNPRSISNKDACTQSCEEPEHMQASPSRSAESGAAMLHGTGRTEQNTSKPDSTVDKGQPTDVKIASVLGASSQVLNALEQDDASIPDTQLPTIEELIGASSCSAVIDLTAYDLDGSLLVARGESETSDVQLPTVDEIIKSANSVVNPADSTTTPGCATRLKRRRVQDARPENQGSTAKRRKTSSRKTPDDALKSFIPVTFMVVFHGSTVEFHWSRHKKEWWNQRMGESQNIPELLLSLAHVRVSAGLGLLDVHLQKNGTEWQGNDINGRTVRFTHETITEMILEYKRGHPLERVRS